MKKIPKLEYWAQKYAKQYWNDTVDCEIRWNKRLKVAWGHVTYKRKDFTPIALEMSPRTLTDPEGNFHGTLKHELCHYFLIKNGIEHNEFDEVFLNELRRVGGTMPYKFMKWECYCTTCHDLVFTTYREKFTWKAYKAGKTCSCEKIAYKRVPFYERIK